MKRATAWIIGVAVALLLAWAALHVFISPINPEQESPSGHFASSCWVCHLVTTSVEATTP